MSTRSWLGKSRSRETDRSRLARWKNTLRVKRDVDLEETAWSIFTKGNCSIFRVSFILPSHCVSYADSRFRQLSKSFTSSTLTKIRVFPITYVKSKMASQSTRKPIPESKSHLLLLNSRLPVTKEVLFTGWISLTP